MRVPTKKNTPASRAFLENMPPHPLTRQRNPSNMREISWSGEGTKDTQSKSTDRAMISLRVSESGKKTHKSEYLWSKSSIGGRVGSLDHRPRRHEPLRGVERSLRRTQAQAQTWPGAGSSESLKAGWDEAIRQATVRESPNRLASGDSDRDEFANSRWDAPRSMFELSQYWTRLEWLRAETPASSSVVDSPEYTYQHLWTEEKTPSSETLIHTPDYQFLHQTSDQDTPSSTARSLHPTPRMTPALGAVEPTRSKLSPLKRSLTPDLSASLKPTATRTMKGSTLTSMYQPTVTSQHQHSRRMHALCLRSTSGEWESVTAIFDESFPQSFLRQETARALSLQPQPLPEEEMTTPVGVLRVDQAAYQVGIKSKMLGISAITVNIFVVQHDLCEADVVVGKPLIEKLKAMLVKVPLQSMKCCCTASTDHLTFEQKTETPGELVTGEILGGNCKCLTLKCTIADHWTYRQTPRSGRSP